MTVILRTIVMYIIVIISLRLMGKKQIGELEPSDLAVAIMISDLATFPLSTSNASLLKGIVPVFTLTLIEIIMSLIILKTIKLRKFITGNPTILIKKGKIVEENFKKTRFTIDDLASEMRLNGISEIKDIEYAVLETKGQVSFILNKENSPLTMRDLKNNTIKEDLSFPVVNKGIILKDNLDIIGRSSFWIKEKIKSKGISDLNKILLVTANHNDITFIQMKEN